MEELLDFININAASYFPIEVIKDSIREVKKYENRMKNCFFQMRQSDEELQLEVSIELAEVIIDLIFNAEKKIRSIVKKSDINSIYLIEKQDFARLEMTYSGRILYYEAAGNNKNKLIQFSISIEESLLGSEW
jgi:hypothetical protein